MRNMETFIHSNTMIFTTCVTPAVHLFRSEFQRNGAACFPQKYWMDTKFGIKCIDVLLHFLQTHRVCPYFNPLDATEGNQGYYGKA